MFGAVVIRESAHKHGVTDAQIREGLANPVRFIPAAGALELLMGVGLAAGEYLEIGLLDDPDHEDLLVVHAMSARPKYWP